MISEVIKIHHVGTIKGAIFKMLILVPGFSYLDALGEPATISKHQYMTTRETHSRQTTMLHIILYL